MKNSNANQSISCSFSHKRKSTAVELSVAKPRVLTHLDSNWELSSLESESKTICSSLSVCSNHILKRSCVTFGEQYEDIFSIDDIGIEILSRLPIESTNELKRVCKRWYELFSHPSFSIAHFQKSARTISGLFVQPTYYCSFCENYLDWDAHSYLSIGKERKQAITKNILEFLPENVVILASCNGILLCRNMFADTTCIDHHCDKLRLRRYSKKTVLYVCNPFTKELTTLRPRDKYKRVCYYGFVYDHFGSLGSPDFEVVMVQAPLQLGKHPYQFKIYSSRIGAWRTSKEVCTFHHRLYVHCSFFTKGVFYWLTTDHSILAFDLKHEKSQVIKLPGHALNEGVRDAAGVCLGVSDGMLHYVCLNYIELVAWVFENDNSKPKWVLKHTKSQLDMAHPLLEGYEYKPFSRIDGYKWANSLMCPCAFEDDIVYVEVRGKFCMYNIKTGKFVEDLCLFWNLSLPCLASTVIPYHKTLLQVKRKA